MEPNLFARVDLRNKVATRKVHEIGFNNSVQHAAIHNLACLTTPSKHPEKINCL